MKIISFQNLITLIKDTFSGYSNDRVSKLSAALAYYTIFSMGPLLLVIISISGMLFSREAVEGKVYALLINFVGSDTAFQMQNIVKEASVDHKNILAGIVGIVMLLLGATGIFGEIQDSINLIWGVKAKPKKNWLKYLQNRFLSFSVIVSLGFLLLVSLVISSLVESVSKNLSSYFPQLTVIVFYIVNLVLTIVISTLIFGTIFKVLPDAKIVWKDILVGALVTSVLFLIGKFAISYYIFKSDAGSAFGAAGSLVVVLLWTFYSSNILYLGAEFTKAYAIKFGNKIHPNDYAVKIEQVVVEKGKAALE